VSTVAYALLTRGVRNGSGRPSGTQVSQYGRMPEPDVRAGDLLAGPRGRELCARLAGIDVREIREQLRPPSTGVALIAEPADAGRLADAEQSGCPDEERPANNFDCGEELAGIPALAGVVEDANYWGGPYWGALPTADPLDQAEMNAEIRMMAGRVAQAAGCQWWWSDIDRAAQQYVQWAAREDSAPVLGHAAEMLRLVDLDADDHERSMSRDRHLPAGSGVAGPWWSHPGGAISTTRRAGRLGAVLLAGQEDGFGDTEAVVWPLAVADKARVFEVDGPGAWQRLVAAYPRTATATYRHTWAWTGWDGEWLMPRWSRVAQDWDGVHLTVAGYLATAGQALPVGTACTLLGGWNPDETYWLADVVTANGEPHAWHNSDRSPLGWKAD
jgi:hypothetical protein